MCDYVCKQPASCPPNLPTWDAYGCACTCVKPLNYIASTPYYGWDAATCSYKCVRPNGQLSPYGRYDDTNADGHYSIHAGSQDYAGSFVKNSKGKKTFKAHGSYNPKTGGKKFHGSG